MHSINLFNHYSFTKLISDILISKYINLLLKLRYSVNDCISTTNWSKHVIL